MRDHIVIIGCGKFGSYLASKLSADGEDVVLIDKKQEAFKQVSSDFTGIEIIDDAFEAHVMEEAEVSKSAQVIIATESDNTNIFLAAICDNIYHAKKIFVRQSNDDKDQLFKLTKYNVIDPFDLSIKKYNEISAEDD